MAGKKRKRLRDEDVTGLKYFDQLGPLLARLHEVGCQGDKAGNRTLHYDQYCLLVLLFFFNPIVRSLRAVQQASELTKVQKKLGCLRASLGSLSESSHVFDPALLKEIIAELGQQLRPIAADARLADLRHTLTLVDGTLLSVLPTLALASWLKTNTGKGQVKWRLHTHFVFDKHVPVRIDVRRDGGGALDERSVMGKAIESDRCYVMDRGFAKFKLFNDIHAAGSSYVCRIRDNSQFEVLQERTLSAEAQAAGVVQDSLVRLGASSKPDSQPDHPLRVVVVKITPHEKRGGAAGHGSDGFLRIATNLLDVPAEIIALIFRHRWSIEIFFRFFKHVLGCRHLISHDQRGIEIQTYCAIIACMLISLWTGRKPTLRTYEMICYFFIGWASEEELLAHLRKLPAHA